MIDAESDRKLVQGDDCWVTATLFKAQGEAGACDIVVLDELNGIQSAPGACQEKEHREFVWLARAAQRLHRNVLAAALANKLARIAWTVLAQERSYEACTTFPRKENVCFTINFSSILDR